MITPHELPYVSPKRWPDCAIRCWSNPARLTAAAGWQAAGVWDHLHVLLLLAELHAAGQIDWSPVAVDGSHARAKLEPGQAMGQARS
jgi:hypothetical protein